MSKALVDVARRLADEVDGLKFGPPVTHVYNPLRYAFAPHAEYLRRFGQKKGRVVLVGMNPGPWGMVQTGVPFGEVSLVRDWMGITGAVEQPLRPHPKRPVQGFDCRRSEVSGARLWGWAKTRFGDADAFFERFFVLNFCPLVFMEQSARNRTPDKLPAQERALLFEACRSALAESLEGLSPRMVLGIGAFAEARAREASSRPVGRILHPSPASPIANRGWAAQAEDQLEALGLGALLS